MTLPATNVISLHGHYSTFELRMHPEVDNEDGSTIRLIYIYTYKYTIQNVWDYA